MLFSKTTTQIKGFSEGEVLNIKADSLYEASVLLGQKMASEAKKVLRGWSKEYRQYKPQVAKCLELLEVLAKKNSLTVGGVNYAQRYLDSLHGFADGVGIKVLQAVFLQMEIESGCQTIIAQDKKTGAVITLHTEENALDDELPDGKYMYKLVQMKLPEKEAVFFAYPGVCGWGPAFNFDKTNELVQTVDDLFIRKQHNTGRLFVNAVAFMLFDCGTKKNIRLLIAKLKKVIAAEGLISGYAIHLASSKQDYFESIEVAADILDVVSPDKDKDRLYMTQSNYPRSKKTGKFSSAYPPKNRKRWSKNDKYLHVEMKRRKQRLDRVYKETTWNLDDPDASIKTGLEILAYPYGDLTRYKDKGQWRGYQTGIVSLWNAAHMVCYLGQKKNKLYVGKFNADPIVGKEYSMYIDESYPYLEKHLSNLVAKLK